LSVGPTGPTQKVFFVKYSLPVNFVVLIRVAYGSGTLTPGNRSGPDPDPEKLYGTGSATLLKTALGTYLSIKVEKYRLEQPW
jgi:hypothetical protein